MKVDLYPGEVLFVNMADAADKDDGVRIEYDYEGSNRFVVTANYPDDRNREGVIYSATLDEDVGNVTAEDDDKIEFSADKDKVVKSINCNSCGIDFSLTQGEVEFMQHIFKDKYREPMRCKKCRMLRMRRKRTPKEA